MKLDRSKKGKGLCCVIGCEKEAVDDISRDYKVCPEHNREIKEKYPKGFRIAQTIRNGVKIGRNEFCPCGSGKKYKACHYKIDRA